MISQKQWNWLRKYTGLFTLSLLMAVTLFWPGRTLKAQTSHGIVLTWTAPTTGGAPASYNVKRGTASGSEVTIASVPAATLTYSDTTGVGGVKYFYVVTAVNASGESGPSNEASATFFLAAPGAPGGLTAAAN